MDRYPPADSQALAAPIKTLAGGAKRPVNAALMQL
jgi:hypothetical protein